MITKLPCLMMVKETDFPTSTIRNRWRKVRKSCVLLLGLKKQLMLAAKEKNDHNENKSDPMSAMQSRKQEYNHADARLHIHRFEKTLLGEKHKRWTIRHNGTLRRWQGQVCYWVSFFDIQNIFFPR